MLDPTIDYKPTLNSSRLNAINENALKEKDKEITDLKAQLEIYKVNIESLKADGRSIYTQPVEVLT